MGNLQEELEVRIESLDIALRQAINLPEVQEYIKKSKELLALKKNKVQFSIEAYNNLIDSCIADIDSLKETPNVTLFLDLLDKYNKSQAAICAIQTVGVERK